MLCVTLHDKISMPDIKRYPRNRNLIKKAEEMQIDKAVKGTVVNRTLSSLHEGSLEITLTQPLSFSCNNYPIHFISEKINDYM